MQGLAEFELAFSWAANTHNLLVELEEVPVHDFVAAEKLFAKLEGSHGQLKEIIQSVPASYLQSPAWQQLYSDLVRTRFEIYRRLMVWNKVTEVMANHVVPMDDPQMQLVSEAIRGARIQLSTFSNHDQWNEYLELEKLDRLFAEGNKFKDVQRRILARKVLARVTSPMLTEEQIQFTREILGTELILSLQKVSTEEVNYHRLLTCLEKFEADPNGVNLYMFNSEFLNLYFSGNEHCQSLAVTIDQLYRNSNFRMTISEELLNRAMPELPEANEPVTDHILGAQVFGHNQIRNRLQLQLVPNYNEMHFRLMTNGSVFSRTRATHSGFTFQQRWKFPHPRNQRHLDFCNGYSSRRLTGFRHQRPTSGWHSIQLRQHPHYRLGRSQHRRAKTA